MQTVAVIIPIYKSILNENEILSLTQCLKILHNHPIIFIAPDNIDFSCYKPYCKEFDYSIIKFSNHYFENIKGYNKLLLSPGFYKRLSGFKFILIYQLDAFVFNDELLYWCSQNFDFIGAPHISHQNLPGEMQFLKNYNQVLKFFSKYLKVRHQISNVGNGGFSLRKTKTCYWLLRVMKNKANKWETNEDGFFKYYGNLLHPLFKLPADKTAIKFSIETFPKKVLKSLNYELPFGCHAWEKYEPAMWSMYLGNSILKI